MGSENQVIAGAVDKEIKDFPAPLIPGREISHEVGIIEDDGPVLWKELPACVLIYLDYIKLRVADDGPVVFA